MRVSRSWSTIHHWIWGVVMAEAHELTPGRQNYRDLPRRWPGASQEKAAYYASGQELKQKQPWAIEIRDREGQGVDVPYTSIISLSFNSHVALTLVCSDVTITLKGRHLQELRKRLRMRQVDFIQEYDERQFQPPGDGEPVIEEVKIDRLPMFKGQ